ncbi:MAG: hydroxymethylpyrimidine/phosphomethylpyrimidine kinase [Roseovarius sp.]|nr:hydroxymethylpyrimidine/phosphomethylpyrimidine kinase [Roseovarius sp.]
MKHVLLIGGTDSSGGAGLTRDTAVTHDLGCLGKPVVTCVTAQTNMAVHLVHQMPGLVIVAQIDAAFADTPPDVIKIGMIGARQAADAIADALIPRNVPIILDPVLRASTGGTLSEDGVLKRLISMADLVTPNLEEASALTNRPFAGSDNEIATQAEILRRHGARAVLITGGHGRGYNCCDHLFDEMGHLRFCLPRLKRSKRGTGCSLATAVGCKMAQGQEIRDACCDAKKYLHSWIAI